MTEFADIETASDDYATRFSGPIGAWLLARQERLILRCLANREGASVLDVGGGHAQIAAPLLARRHPVTVVASGAAGFRQLERRQLPVRQVIGDLLHLPFPDRSFDVVTCVRLLPHCEEWQQLMRELCRVATHTVIVDYPTVESVNVLSPLLFKAKRGIERNTRTFRLFSHREVDAALNSNGFRRCWRGGQFMLPMVLHRVLGNAPVARILEMPFDLTGLTARFGSPVILCAERA